jgi:DNA polymerase/3'-5' exonuclease PolX
VVRELLPVLQPACVRLIVAGSLRRRKREVGDVELLYIPKIIEVPDPDDFFGRMIKANAVDLALTKLNEEGALSPRLKCARRPAWGERNKLARHVASGIGVDLFTADLENWWNLLVCRTGGATSNTQICMKAQEGGWKWNPYGSGFSLPNPAAAGLALDQADAQRAGGF